MGQIPPTALTRRGRGRRRRWPLVRRYHHRLIIATSAVIMLQLLLLVRLMLHGADVGITTARIYVRRVVIIREGMMLLMGVTHHRRPQRRGVVTTLGLIVCRSGVRVVRLVMVSRSNTTTSVMMSVMGMWWI